MKIKVISVFMLAVVMMLAGCGKKDGDIQKAAADKLTADRITGVTVAVNDGVATLTGEVTDITVKSRAEASVKGVEGVKSVTNNINLRALPTPPPPSPDRMLEGVVNESLKKKGITGVTVTASNGEITLSGKVDKAKVPEVMMAANEANPSKVINNLNK